MSPILSKFIATRDARIAKEQPWRKTPFADAFAELVSKGVVTMGGRATCGPNADPTWKEFRAWNEIVSKARKLGYEITEQSIKHGNGWATKAGGFWEEREYRLASTKGEAA